MEDMKQVCVGCVWIQPSWKRPRWSCASKISSSLMVEHESEVASCLGTTSVLMVKTPFFRVPASTAHVSRFFRVFA